MADTKTQDKNKNKTPAPAAAAAKEAARQVVTTAANPAAAPKPKKAKRQRVRLVSKTIAGLWVRMFVDVLEKHGAPYDKNGDQLVPATSPAPAFGLSAEERAKRKLEKETAKAAEKAAFEALSPEEKLAFAEKQRTERQAAKAAKKAKEREAMIAEVKAMIERGEI